MRLRGARFPLPKVFSVWVSTNEITITDVYFFVPFLLHLVLVSRIFGHLEAWASCISGYWLRRSVATYSRETLIRIPCRHNLVQRVTLFIGSIGSSFRSFMMPSK